MRGSRNFPQWGGGGGAVQSDIKSSDNVVFCVCFFLVLSLFFGNEMVIFKEIDHFQGSRGGPTFSRGVEGEGGRAPCPPPLDPHLVHAEHMGPWLRAQRRFALKLIGVFT